MSSSTTSPPSVPIHYSLYCRKRSPIGASAALILQWYNAQYRVCWDEKDVGVDSPALHDPHTDETIAGFDIVPHLLKSLDTEKKRKYEEGTLGSQIVQIRIDRMMERIQAGDPVRFAFDLETYLREERSCRVVGRTTAWARDPRTLNAMASVGWRKGDAAYDNLLERNGW